MAQNTSKSLRNQVIYSVYVRNYSEEGTFEALRYDLDRIRDLGVDIIWLLPIYPIGEKARKGTLGSPYAIRDYRQVNPEYGTMEDFVRLVDAIHGKGMKCVIDIVYNHTAPDSWLAAHHPEWFYHRADGSFGNKVGDWSDIIDLDYSNTKLWDYQIDTLKMWAQIVDGFRCDVAPMIPLNFWLTARREVAKVREDCIWLAESMELSFIAANRARGVISHSDGEMLQAFDLSYEYDVYPWCRGYLAGNNTLAVYASQLNLQEGIYPENYVKLRFLENHDVPRAHALIVDTNILENWTAFLYFQKGATLVYAGQEMGCCRTPSLFEKDPVQWKAAEEDCAQVNLSGLMARLSEIKKDTVFTESSYHVQACDNDILVAIHTRNHDELHMESDDLGAEETEAVLGLFCMKKTARKDASRGIALFEIETGDFRKASDLYTDGVYENLLDGARVEITGGYIVSEGKPVVIRAKKS